jgi:hypothetical protein
MNERIKELAKQAGFDVEDRANEIWFDEGWHTSIVERFAELVRQDEREACAKVCEDLDNVIMYELAGWQYGEEIRARGNT